VGIKNMKFSKVILLLASIGIFFLGVMNQEGYASLITYDFTGSVVIVDPLLSGQFNTTQTISGSFTYDTSTPDSDPTDFSGFYYNAITALTFRIDGYTGSFILSPINESVVIKDDGADLLYFLTGVAAPDIGPLPAFGFDLGFVDYTRSAFTNDSLPETIPDPSFFDLSVWGYHVQTAGDFHSVWGDFTSFTKAPSQVPEPSTMLLIGTGLAGVGIMRKRFKK
jgi:hypothetical protein